MVKFINRSHLSDKRLSGSVLNIFSIIDKTLCDLRSIAESQLIIEQDSPEGKQKLCTLLLVARISEISEAALLIMKHGMVNESHSLLRIFLDAYFVFGAICSDKNTVQEYFSTDEAARLKLFNVAKENNSELFDEIKERITPSTHNELKERVGKEKIQEFKSFNFANKIGCDHIFNSLYRTVSASVHSTPRSLLEYVETDENGYVETIICHPDPKEIPDVAYNFAYFLIKVLSGLTEVFSELNPDDISKRRDELEKAISQK